MNERSGTVQTSRVIFLFFVALTSAYMVFMGCGRVNEENTVKAAGTTVGERVYEVRSARVEVMDLDYSLDVVGSLMPNENVAISSEVTGIVENILVDEGEHVQKGETLLKIDDEKVGLKVKETRSLVREAEVGLDKLMAWTREERVKQVKANLDQARIDLEKVTKDYERYKELYEGGVVDKSTFDTMDAGCKIAKKKVLTAEEEYEIALSGPTKEEVELAKAKVDRAKTGLRLAEKNLKDMEVTSPITGIVSERTISIGEYVKPGTKLFEIVQNDPLKLSFSIPEKFAGDVKEGQTVIAGVKAFPKEKFMGKVYYISPESERSTRSFEVKAKISNKNNRLKPGFFADVTLITSVRKDAFVIPEEAILLMEGKPVIYIVRGDKVILQPVEVGRRFGGKVEVTSSDLKEDDTVVTEGQDGLIDNA